MRALLRDDLADGVLIAAERRVARSRGAIVGERRLPADLVPAEQVVGQVDDKVDAVLLSGSASMGKWPMPRCAIASQTISYHLYKRTDGNGTVFMLTRGGVGTAAARAVRHRQWWQHTV